MQALTVQNLWKSFDGKPAVRGVSFAIEPGETVALLGPSGCGKSTVLNLIAGLIQPDQGSLAWQGQSLAGVPPHRRGFGLMFQDYALFPHLNVQENITFGLKLAGASLTETHDRVSEMLSLVGLEGFGKRDVNTLSGGEAQRVALARSLAPRPRFLMLDEPLGALDRALRQRLVMDLRHILRQLQQTALYVTHDQEEAFTLANRVVLLNQGQVAQVGSPQQIYRQPANPFVARFLGLDNLLEGSVITSPGGPMVQTAAGLLPLPVPAFGKVVLLLRPDAFHLSVDGPARLQGRMIGRIYQGSLCRLQVQVGQVQLSFDLPGTAELPKDGEEILLSFDPQQAIHFFQTEATAR